MIRMCAALASAIITQVAYAQPISGAAQTVAGNSLLASFGIGGFEGIALFIRDRALLLLFPIGAFLVVRAGLQLINSQDEGKLETAKRTIASTCVGIMLAWISLRLVNAFYFPGGAWNAGTVEVGANILATEIGGIINMILTFVAVLSVLMIVASGLKALGSFGKEENATEVRQTVTGVITGIGLIIIRFAVKASLGLGRSDDDIILPGNPSAGPIIARGVEIVQNILTFLALAAVIVIIYAGLLMIFNLGNEDQFKKAKSIIIRTVVGLSVVLLSIVIVNFIVDFFLK